MRNAKRGVFGIVFFMPLWQMEENIKTAYKSFTLRCLLLVFKLFFFLRKLILGCTYSKQKLALIESYEYLSDEGIFHWKDFWCNASTMCF